ncbi:DUF3017 domain-containing protein [Streptomyces oceani]|uniref:DUF3017 domain-containing protein n=1 Tax=Streptomyces oceani TaxID=1075402 RepID=A0A1E7KI29_9ACTN|nr:DUF3017 domain-containing protein [Streptomyces oceani]OEV03567.1 hypothetical protein AN216_10910 [Streptomyces oceani]
MGLGSGAEPESTRRRADEADAPDTADGGAGAAASQSAGREEGTTGERATAAYGAGDSAAGAREPRSRRFPTFTRDTARPEGGARAAGGQAPAPYRQWPLLAVCAGVLLGLLVTLLEFRSGTIIMGLSLIGAGALRWSRTEVGMLAVRSRFTDVATYATLGCLITLLAMMAQPNPWITIPVLEDILHFSVQ